MSKLRTACCLVVIVVLIAVSLSAWHKFALDEAERQARMRLLSSFHRHYLRSAGLDKQDYLEKLKNYNKAHSGMLDEYVKRIESDEE